jgi:hypothetical protein
VEEQPGAEAGAREGFGHGVVEPHGRAAYTHAHLLVLRFSAVLAWGAISAQISPTPAAKQQVKLLQLLKTAEREPSQVSFGR